MTIISATCRMTNISEMIKLQKSVRDESMYINDYMSDLSRWTASKTKFSEDASPDKQNSIADECSNLDLPINPPKERIASMDYNKWNKFDDTDENDHPSDWYRLKGNEYFRSGNIHEALNTYCHAMKLASKEERKTLYLNISACHLSLGNFTSCLDFANRTLKLDPTNLKALFRKCKSLLALNKLKDAQESIENALQLCNHSNDSLEQLKIEIDSALAIERHRNSEYFDYVENSELMNGFSINVKEIDSSWTAQTVFDQELVYTMPPTNTDNNESVSNTAELKVTVAKKLYDVNVIPKDCFDLKTAIEDLSAEDKRTLINRIDVDAYSKVIGNELDEVIFLAFADYFIHKILNNREINVNVGLQFKTFFTLPRIEIIVMFVVDDIKVKLLECVQKLTNHLQNSDIIYLQKLLD
ncbi:hypothetical protein GJ496_011172 [Pomphorhynchus laevis]|nr:hypothetical protein GJ496_011172 [Pomphorhynchus laevis]